MSLDYYIQSMLPAIEDELKKSVADTDAAYLEEFCYMLSYHLGWQGEGAGVEARGKRVRPLLTLLTAAAAGGEWEHALPAAAAIELVHNFSLIHDDIQDNSLSRRGRPTVWRLWGIAQAINAGDAMFTLAHLSMARLASTTSTIVAYQANKILQLTCLHLTQGQYLDLSYEARSDLDIESYWPMVSNKTAALFGACTEIGALSAGAEESIIACYRVFGHSLGLAFQVYDDILGIWGDTAITGKSIQSDMLTGKKSLPILFGLSLGGQFARRWTQGRITPEEIPALARLLEQEGAHAFTQEHVSSLTGKALTALDQAEPSGEAGLALRDLALGLINRQG